MGECPMDTSVVELGDQFLADRKNRAVPYATFAALHASAPVLRTSSGAILVTGYAQARAVLSDDASWSRAEAAARHAVVHDGPSREIFNSKLLAQDAPAHRRLRSLVAKAFSPAAIRRLEGRIRVICRELLDGVRDQGRMDLVRDYGLTVPERVICEMLGVPADDVFKFEHWAAQITEVPPGGDIEAARDQATEAFDAFSDYIRETVARRRGDGGVDLLSTLMLVEEEGSRLSEKELIGLTFELITAGHETTAKLIPNAVATLLANPDQLKLLRDDPSLIPDAVEEVMRFESSAQMCLPRVAKVDLELGGQQVAKGDTVIVMLGAANRDESRFPRADVFDVTRADNDHVGFGFGSHFCIGHTLAKVEMKVALEELLLALPGLQLVEGTELQWVAGNMTRGLAELPVRW